MDERERDKFYSSTSDDEDDGNEYEVEPPDAEVLAGEERRGKEALESTQMQIDIDEIFREADRDHGGEILDRWLRNFQFRFQVKHLLIATAVVAILLTLARLRLLGTVVVLVVMISVAGLYLYLQWQDKKRQDEANRRRQEMYARRRAHFARTSRPPGAEADDTVSPAAPSPPPLLPPNEVDEIWQKAQASQKFRFRFSMWELMAAMTAAAMILGLVQLLGGASNTATLLGFVALFGLVIHALGFEPPEVVVLGWWLILVLYVVLSVVAVAWRGFG